MTKNSLTLNSTPSSVQTESPVTPLGLLYLNTAEYQVQNIMGSLFFLVVNMSFSALFATLQTFPAELPVFRLEIYWRGGGPTTLM